MHVMGSIHLRSVDLNLLVVLDALLSERHVTRAGKRLGLSQSATSNALERLRSLFGDPILERTRGGMTPTPRAQALRPALEHALSSVAQVVGPRADLATLSQTVRWSVVDYGTALLGPPLMAALRDSAPGLDLIVTPWGGAEEVVAELSDGTLDLAVSVMAPGASMLRWQPLFSERYIVAMRRDHPAKQRFSLDKWLQYPHVVVSGRAQTSGALDAALASQGKARRVGLVVPSFLAVPSIVGNSDLLALVPERLLATGPYANVITREPPLPVPSFEVGIAWHPRRDHDVATMHVIHALMGVARDDPKVRGTAKNDRRPKRAR
ncbi:Transcriptional regulator [Labilithrix luteola]|uniref:Transcriptional regulator n=2 Tax=Labilithrix luteola TaxID=1391654 RepID=A0A0K1PQ21_9BACT|nr:Transcriptional regulator [Labilithrix luteola]